MLIAILLALLSFSLTVIGAPAPLQEAPSFSRSSRPYFITYSAAVASVDEIYSPGASVDIVTNRTFARPLPGVGATTMLAGTACETSSVSPFTQDITSIITYLYAISNSWCCQMIPGSACTSMATYWSAGIGICALQNRCLRCGYAALGAEEIVRSCKQRLGAGDRAGGKYGWDQLADIYVFHAFRGFNR